MEVIIAPNETYLDSKNTTKKIPKEMPAEIGLSPMIIPNEVATPFPPLN